ncbi:MAG TPA: AMP-binding protein [Opitutaceae bacterium]|nr:AMP-binding protein [Opitutaceae bacterium]
MNRTNPTAAFLQARDFLLAHREDYAGAYAGFQWPKLDRFNWALDYFDVMARDNHRPALWVTSEDGHEEKPTFAQLSTRSNRVANFLRRLGVRRGDRILVMLPNIVPLWEITLAAIRLGAVISPASTLLPPAELAERVERGRIRHVVTDPAGVAKFGLPAEGCTRIVVGGEAAAWTNYVEADAAPAEFTAEGETRSEDPLLLYFTSGTTAQPKMVLHTHASYPVGHLSTMYWLGLRPGDVHLNISSPGWAKHAWSCLFAPWNAGATVFIHNQPRFDARKMLEALVRHEVTSLCAPPTVWRMVILQDLERFPVKLRELTGAGEPLNPEVIDRVRGAWGLTIRDGYGQTETTCVAGNSPGQAVHAGAMGRPMPGYRVALVGLDGQDGNEGELCLELNPAPTGLMAGYLDASGCNTTVRSGAHYRTSDFARRGADGYIEFVGRTDDVFKSSDYRISPFELESALLEHEPVAESAVVPSPDPVRLSVPKAFVVLKAGQAADRAAALAIFRFIRARLAPYKRVRRLEFAELPKTISGKIRRVELRATEERRRAAKGRAPTEFWEDDFPELRDGG